MPNNISQNNKRIAKNAIMLYVRMLLSIAVSLYTSRVILQTLGVEDYGIYGVVGGVVAMFSFLNAAMSGATSRFLTFEMGKAKYGNDENGTQIIRSSHIPNLPHTLTPLQKTFSSAMIIHMAIALVVFSSAITVGLWFLNNKLVIPEERMTAAYWVYVCSIAGMFISVTQVPYNAAIIAHEKMDVYAYVDLLNVFLKLAIVYLLLIGNFDKLILYALLMLCVNVIVAMTYRIYCLKHYEETHFHWIIDKRTLKSITSFSLYNLFGNAAWVMNNQGTNFILNMFFGVTVNAAASIASTVSNVINGFATNIMTAFRPAVTKAFASGNYIEFENLLNWAIKIILIIYSLIAIPVCITADKVLSIWLVEVPRYAVVFCQLMLISLYWETFKQLIVMGIHACGHVRFVSLLSGIVYCINPMIIYVCFKFGLPASFAYISAIFMNMFIGIVDIFIMKFEIRDVPIRSYCISLASVTAAVASTFGLWDFIPHIQVTNTFASIVIDSLQIIAIFATLSYTVVLNSSQRNRLSNIVKNKVTRKL